MYQTVIIIGAPRSGTNMLRNMLIKLPGAGTWQCDEINYIWRHGNCRYPSDELEPEMATKKVKHYIRGHFNKIAQSQKLDMVIEKTCANSLRVNFVDQIFPDAKYIFIVRDGIDVVGSAMQRWKANLDISYVLQKVKYVPIADFPYYGRIYLVNRLFKFFLKRRGSNYGDLYQMIYTR